MQHPLKPLKPLQQLQETDDTIGVVTEQAVHPFGVYERLCWEIMSGHHAARRDRKRAKEDSGRLGRGESPRAVRCSI